MIQTETITINGKQFQRTWSDVGYMIERDGALYSEAVDPINTGRTYSETDERIAAEGEAADEIDPDEAVSAVKILLGMEE